MRGSGNACCISTSPIRMSLIVAVYDGCMLFQFAIGCFNQATNGLMHALSYSLIPFLPPPTPSPRPYTYLSAHPPTQQEKVYLPPATPKCLGGNREAKSLPASGGSLTQPLPRSLLREGAQLNHCPGLCFGGRARHGSYTAPVLATMVMKAVMKVALWLIAAAFSRPL